MLKMWWCKVAHWRCYKWVALGVFARAYYECKRCHIRYDGGWAWDQDRPGARLRQGDAHYQAH